MRQKKTIFISILIIFLANIALVWPLFLGGYTREMGSIESVFIADARFILENFPHLSWNPYWYAGFPFHLFYTPLLPALMALLHFLVPVVSIASWYRILIGLFYAATPVSFYFLVRFLTGKSLVGFLAALVFSFWPSLSYLLPQVGGMAGIYNGAPWRFLTLILYGEGGHIVGLFFLPLALLFFIKAVREASWRNVFLASLMIGLLALTNMIALIGFGVMVAIVLAVELLAGEALRKLGRATVVLLFSFGLSAFWFNLSFVKASLSIGTGGVAGGVGGVYLPLLPFIFLAVPVLFFVSIVARSEKFRLLLIAFGWVAVFFAAAYFWFNGQNMLLPQPNRYFPEMDMGVAIITTVILSFILEHFFTSKLTIFRYAIYLVLAIGVFYWPWKYYQAVWNLSQPNTHISQTAEYQTAQWLKDHTRGERIYASGTTAFWLNTFTNIPQLRGGNDGVANPWILHGVYQINTGENAPKGKEGLPAIDWLRAFNVSYLVVNTPSSPVAYHDFKFPERFLQIAGVEEIGKVGGDIIYQVPLNQPSLAQAVKKTDFENLTEPKNAVDVDAIGRYVNYIDGSSFKEAKFDWTGIGQAVIKADLGEKEGIAVQVTYDPGWHASVGSKKIPLKKDVLGFIYLQPGKAGPVEVNLRYTRTWDVWLGYLVTFLALVGLFIYPKLHQQGSKLFKSAEKEWEKE